MQRVGERRRWYLKWAVCLAGLGFAFYVLNAIWAGYLIVPVPLSGNFCLKWEALPKSVDRFDKVSYERFCSKFLNTYEEDKYYYNVREQKKLQTYRYVSLAIYAAFIFFPVFAYYKIWQRSKIYNALVSALPTTMVTFMISAVILPAVYLIVLPAPEAWFPEFVAEYRQQAVHDALNLLR